MIDIVTVVLGLLLAICRMVGIKDESFQAIAHLYMGVLIGLWFANRRKLYFHIVILLSLVEVVCFVVSHINGR